eukprot:GILI01025986.1.p1 GENE.GILI01025986.1~~GILI01025986.1.p1  ORF type:complete len:492 (-),score=80.43 GILI01025986.1:50-1405(-)
MEPQQPLSSSTDATGKLPPVSRRTSAFLTEVDTRPSLSRSRDRRSSLVVTPGELKTVYKVEDADIPDPDDGSIPPLPDTVNLDRVRDNVLNSLAFPNSRAAAVWREEFSSEHSTAVICDSFWFVVSHFFQKKGDTFDKERKFFTRISHNFVSLFLRIHPSRKDLFFGRYHDAVSQSIFYSLYIAYPKSRPKFSLDFRDNLLCMVTEWSTGIFPSQPSTLHWRLDLGAGNVFKTLSDMPGGRDRSSPKNASGRGPALGGSSAVLSLPSLPSPVRSPAPPSRESTTGMVVGDAPELFVSPTAMLLGVPRLEPPPMATSTQRRPQTLQYSPLVQHFLAVNRYKSLSLVKPIRVCLTKPTLKDRQVDNKFEKYVEVASSSLQHSTELLNMYDTVCEDFRREMKAMREETSKYARTLDRRREQIMSGDHHEYANYLVSMWTLTDGQPNPSLLGELS